MKLLKEGLEQRVVERTTMTRKLTVDGLTKAYPVYKIRLDWLFYNDQNDRIATWISQYKAQHGGQAPDISQREEYNNIIEQFIVESNPDAIRKTQSNIEMVWCWRMAGLLTEIVVLPACGDCPPKIHASTILRP